MFTDRSIVSYQQLGKRETLHQIGLKSLSSSELRILLIFISALIKEQKDELPIVQNKISELLGLRKSIIARSINSLLEKNILGKTEYSTYTVYFVKQLEDSWAKL